MKKPKVLTKNIKAKYFTERVNHYFFKVFHMYFYELNISQINDVATRASTYWHPLEDGAGMISIFYSEDWIDSEELTLEEVDKVAFHEVMEALLSELQELAYTRFISEKDIPSATHRVIRILENIIHPLICDK